MLIIIILFCIYTTTNYAYIYGTKTTKKILREYEFFIFEENDFFYIHRKRLELYLHITKILYNEQLHRK